MKILVVDAYNMIHRSRFGFGSGDHSIVFNFFRSLKSEIARHESDLVYVVSEGRPNHRCEINKDYKGQRKRIADDGFHRQKNEILSLCHSFPFVFARHPHYECDDVIGHICTKLHREDDVTIVSSDSDFIQLLENETVKLWNPVKKKFIDKWPVDYVTWKSLKGDATDNIPGVKGIGEKRAFALCESDTTLNDFLNSDPQKREVFESAKKQIKLADIDDHCSLWEMSSNTFDEAYIKNTFTEFEFKTIIGKSWYKWKDMMEALNDNLQRKINGSATDIT